MRDSLFIATILSSHQQNYNSLLSGVSPCIARMKQKTYTGQLKNVFSKKIYINIQHLDKGVYELKIVHNNKIVRSFEFLKD